MGRPFAVAVHRRGVLIGYLPKPDARPIAKLLDRGGRARAFVLALKHERSLTGSRLKSITIEIEAANPEDAPWSDADRAEIAALGIEAPLTQRRRNLAVPGRIAGALCAGVVAMAAWANIPELTPELESAENAAMLALAEPSDAGRVGVEDAGAPGFRADQHCDLPGGVGGRSAAFDGQCRRGPAVELHRFRRAGRLAAYHGRGAQYRYAGSEQPGAGGGCGSAAGRRPGLGGRCRCPCRAPRCGRAAGGAEAASSQTSALVVGALPAGAHMMRIAGRPREPYPLGWKIQTTR